MSAKRYDSLNFFTACFREKIGGFVLPAAKSIDFPPPVVRFRGVPFEPSKPVSSPPQPLDDVSWLTEVREVCHPVNQAHPLMVTPYHVASGPSLPEPTVPHPQRHPYCELGCNFTGRITQYIGTEKIERGAGDMMLLPPGAPHYATRHSYPHSGVTVFFLPMLLFEMGPEGDGARALARFTNPQKIGERVVQFPAALAKKNMARFKEMAIEFAGKKVAHELRLRALLLDVMTDLLRWEEEAGRKMSVSSGALNWSQLEKALRFIHEHYSEPLYVEQIARTAGLSVSRLQALFHEALGMSCVQYLRSYRISHASAMLCSPDARVTDIALSVGFETLSHFNTSFRSFMGMSPTQYIRKYSGNRN
ncbi:hypothetical protein BH09VER1_BH09VER1_17090 [soil metagenome]